MTRYPIFGSAQPVDPAPESTEPSRSDPPEENQRANTAPALEPYDLEAALQLLVERAQYITGATGTALALAQGSEMVCRASAGSCAPPVGARLQVQSGLTGESVARKQLLRCDNAENDPRVNLETCRQLGIASIVVLPLLSKSGDVRGLFELFSDHAYAFEERDLIALERMAELTRTALDLAEKTAIVIPPRATKSEEAEPKQPGVDEGPRQPVPTTAQETAALLQTRESSSPASAVGNLVVETLPAASQAPVTPPAAAPSVPESMRRVQKCSSCGFPVSEGRTLCVDCEEKQHREPEAEEVIPAEFVPTFGVSSSSQPMKESWLANHVNLLAILVLILSVVVAIVLFK
jgi:putative methionine-R-sulfoxide reductase with GAF domain